MTAGRVEEVVAILRASRRYRGLHERTLLRVAAAALALEAGRVQPAAKRAKRSLHQIFGAYLPDRPHYARLLEELHGAGAARDPERLRAALRAAMTRHASTRERLGIVERFYREIFARLGEVRRVLDVACGLNPLALPWMSLAPGARYVAVDLDADLIEFVAMSLDVLEVEHDARVLDVVEEVIEGEFDVAFLLKLLPCLEHQDEGAAVALLRSIRARHLVVSFPTRSIGGRDKGMRETYSTRFEELLTDEGLRAERLEFPGELVYLIAKEPAERSPQVAEVPPPQALLLEAPTGARPSSDDST